MSFDNFPYFRYAGDTEIHDVEMFPYGGDDHSGRLSWPKLGIDLLTEFIERIAGGGPIGLRQRIIVHPDRIGKLVDRKRDPNNGKKEFSVYTTFTFAGCFTVTADSEEEARQIVDRQCEITCGGVHVDILTAPLDSVEWDFTIRPVKKIVEIES